MFRISTKTGTSFVFLVFVLLFHTTCSKVAEQPVKQVLDTMFAQYDKAIRPFYGDKPVEVGISIYVIAVYELNEESMDFRLTMYLRQNWTDPRLTFRVQRPKAFGLNNTVFLDENRTKSLWIPDTFVVNEKNSLVHQDTTTNEFVKVYTNGTVLKSARYTMTLRCTMNLQFFPFDRQRCPIHLESFSGTTNDIRFEGDNSSVIIANEINVSPFRIIGHSVQKLDINSTQGNHSRLTVNFVFERSFAHSILRFYVPIGVSVTVSLFALLLASSVIEPLIHVINICFVVWYRVGARVQNFPAVSYITALDIYLLICIGHLLLCLLVSLVVSCRERNQRDVQSSRRSGGKPLAELDTYRGGPRRKQPCCNAGSILFCCLKWAVIGSFVALNIVYWLYYRHISLVVNKKLRPVINDF